MKRQYHKPEFERVELEMKEPILTELGTSDNIFEDQEEEEKEEE